MIFHAIGLMSGTSLDGLDICYASFEKNKLGTWNFKILKSQTIAYSQNWETKLRQSIYLKSEELYALNSEYGFFLGETVQEFITKNQIKNINVIASHGHTIFHQPKKKFTVQIGDGRAIKIITKIPVVYDFRSQDVLLKGNGAPLVPIGDELLFSQYDACLNLGGFSNISMRQNSRRIGFDICPVNIVLNHYSKKLNREYDEGGILAKSGNVDEEILSKLNSKEFYKNSPPKSLGIEWVLEEIFPVTDGLLPENALATFTEHAAEKISGIFEKYKLNSILITGGGAYNDYLIQKIKAKSEAKIVIPNQEIIDYKEALIFAFMGVLRINNENNVLSSGTGSVHDHCSGLLV